jgi:hypothetical protein
MAAGDIKQVFGTSTALTITLASLASSATAGRESTAVDNTSNLFLDAHVFVQIALQAGTPANDKAVYVYLAASEDGAEYTDNATGSDAAITLRDPTNLRLLGVINCPDSGGLTYKSHLMSVAAACGGMMPRKWNVVVRNYTGVTFSATAGDHEVRYTGIYANVAA